MTKRFLRRQQVEKSTGLRRSAIYEMMASGTFPKCFLIGERMVAWHEAEIEAWKTERLKAAGKMEAA